MRDPIDRLVSAFFYCKSGTFLWRMLLGGLVRVWRDTDLSLGRGRSLVAAARGWLQVWLGQTHQEQFNQIGAVFGVEVRTIPASLCRQ